MQRDLVGRLTSVPFAPWLRALLLALAWLALAPMEAEAADCGGPGQRACCILEPERDNIGGACQDGLTEVIGWDGGGCSSSHCVQAAACGGPGQRGCCVGDPGRGEFGACQDGLTEVNDCSGGEASCLCGGDGNPLGVQSTSTCLAATPCGGPGQRACCLGEDSGALGQCRQDTGSPLVEIQGCTGNCLCGGDANPLRVESSGTCVPVSECGGKGQRACIVGEREGTPCNEDLVEVPRCVGDCRGKGDGSSFGISSGMCSTPETISEPTTNRSQPPPEAPTGASSVCPLYGYMDMHLHLFANLAHGGGVLAGKPYDEAGGVNAALQQCAGSNLDLVTQDLKTGAETAVLPPGLSCPIDFYPNGCGQRILHGGHDIFNDSAGFGTRDGALEGLAGENSGLAAPLFNGWPRWTTTTHQQSYYKWLERAWQGGLRLTTMLAVTNEALCKGGKHVAGVNCENSMLPVEQQIAEARKFESFIDKQYGTDAENKGWFRIVETPAEARRAIAKGQLAVVLGVETAELFNCKFPIEQCTITETVGGRTVSCPGTNDMAATAPLTVPVTVDGEQQTICTADFVKNRVEYLHGLGVRHVFPIHNFDNGFGGSATWQDAIEVGNRVVEKHWWFPEGCPADGGNYGFQLGDLTQFALSLIKFFFPGVITETPDRVLATDPPSCNAYGLFSLGQTLVSELMDKGMLIDVDHMSRKAFDKTLEMAEARRYPGIVASHVISFDLNEEAIRHERMRTKSQLQRIKGVGGMIAAMLKDDTLDSDRRGLKYQRDYAQSNVRNDCRNSSKSFAQAYEYAVDVMGGPVAMGSDFNGTAGHFGPRFGSDACGGEFPFDATEAISNATAQLEWFRERAAQYGPDSRKLEYPFALPGFGSLGKQVTGQRVFDYNFDGLAHIGLLPDFVADLETVGMSGSDLNLLFRSAEAYIRVWEGARRVGLGEQADTSAPACLSITGSYSPATIFENTPVSFTAEITPAGLPVTWDFGDGQGGSGANPSHLYPSKGTYTVKASATDPLFGTTAEQVMQLQVRSFDVTPPVVTVPAPITREATSPQGTAVGYSASATDNVDGPLPVSCAPASGSVFPLGTTDVNCSAKDEAGNVGSASFTITVVDTTPPAISLAVSPQANPAGWHKDPVSIQWTVTDIVGVTSATGCGAATFVDDTQGTLVTCTARDAAGNTSSRSVTVRLDRTAPSIGFAAPSPLANANGWHRTDVFVGYAFSDAGSGLVPGAPTGGTLTFTNEGAGQAQTVATVDVAGNVASATSPVLSIDKTPPQIAGSRSPLANAAGWNNTPVTVSFTCADALSGIEACSGPTTLFGEGANQSQDGLARDRAGNTASATVSGINIDLTPPVVTCSNSAPLLSPPNHRLVNVQTRVGVDGGTSPEAGFTLVSVASSEPDNGLGDGDTAGDIQGFAPGTGDTSGQVRAECSGRGPGRIYSLVYEGADLAGNRTTCTTTVSVPKSEGGSVGAGK